MKHVIVPSRLPFQWRKRGEVPSSGKSVMTFCALVHLHTDDALFIIFLFFAPQTSFVLHWFWSGYFKGKWLHDIALTFQDPQETNTSFPQVWCFVRPTYCCVSRSTCLEIVIFLKVRLTYWACMNTETTKSSLTLEKWKKSHFCCSYSQSSEQSYLENLPIYLMQWN